MRAQSRSARQGRDGAWLRSLVFVLVGLPLMACGVCAAFLHAGNFLEAPAQAPVAADLIVSLGGDSGSRIRKSLDLYHAGFAPRILITGMYPLVPATFNTEWRARLMRRDGLPGRAMLFDASAVNSWDEAVYTLRLMREHGWDRVVVVSDPPHLRRLEWTWNRVFEGSGKKFVLVASNLQTWDADEWWKKRASADYVAREFVKLAFYVATKRAGPT